MEIREEQLALPVKAGYDPGNWKHRMPEHTIMSDPQPLLGWGDVNLLFIQEFPGDPEKGFAPYYHFRIATDETGDAGFINFRIGETAHVLMFAGHIGYEVYPECRGKGLALAACRAIAPFVRSFYRSVIITCDPDNEPSRKTIERLGARFLNEVPVPKSEPAFDRGSRVKRRYEWQP